MFKYFGDIVSLSQSDFEKVLKTGDYEVKEYPTIKSAVFDILTNKNNELVAIIEDLLETIYSNEDYSHIVNDVITSLIRVDDKYYYLTEK